MKSQQDDDARRPRRGRRVDDDDDDLGGAAAKDPHLVDRRYYEPPKLEVTLRFKEWSDGFVDYIEYRNPALGAKLRVAMKIKTNITEMGGDDISLKQAGQLYRVMKKVTIHADARPLVVHVEGRNPWEAWRQLHEKYDPRNDTTANAIMVKALDQTK